MKILAAGDIHGDISISRRLAEQADKENVDLVLICGDITNFDQPTPNLISPFLEKNKRVLFVPGNHDSDATVDFLAEMYKITNLQGYSLKMGDVGFFGCGAVNIGLHQITDIETFDMLKKGFEYVKDQKKTIMVTHTHPEGSDMGKLTTIFPGSIGVEKAIKEFKPTLLLCSHVHEAEGIEEMMGETLIVNVGKKGKIIDL